MIVARYTDSAQSAWDQFVATSSNGTFMHSRRFLSYHPPDRFRDHSLSLSEDETLVGVFPAAETQLNSMRTLQSHPGASYGGLLIDKSCDAPLADRCVAALVDYGRQQRFEQIWMRLPETVFRARPCGELDRALFRAGFAAWGRELSSAIDLQGLREESIVSRFHKNAVRNVRRAQQEGVTARVSDDYADYWQLLAQNLTARYEVAPTHTLAEILRLRELLGDRILLVGGYREQLLSGMVVFFMNEVAAHTMYFAQDYAQKHHCSLHLVVHEAIRQCLRRGVRFLNYGISTVPGSRGLELNEGVYEFKRRLGGEDVLRDILVKRL
jgi:hypothetical protein